MNFARRILLLALIVASPASLAAQASTVILVRHAEKAGPSGDVDLSAIGQTRATDLATALAAFPVQGIFTSQYKRTQQTAAPVAARLGLTPVAVPVQGGDARAQAAATATAIRALPTGSAALVVGHSNTVGLIVEALGGPKLDDLCDGEYAAMLVLDLSRPSAPRLLRASYGAPDGTEAVACHRTMQVQ